MNEERIARARLALEGLNVGDCFGETYFVGFGGFRDKAKSIFGAPSKTCTLRLLCNFAGRMPALRVMKIFVK